MKNLGTVFAYAVRQEYWAGSENQSAAKASVKRARYTDEDLSLIFSNDLYTRPHQGPAWHFWLPLLGLYTGALLNEICQLYLDDVVQVEQVYCLYIRAEKPDQKIKSLVSERLIPIHSH